MKWLRRIAEQPVPCAVCYDAIKKGERCLHAKENVYIQRHTTCNWVLGWPENWRIMREDGTVLAESTETLRPDKVHFEEAKTVE